MNHAARMVRAFRKYHATFLAGGDCSLGSIRWVEHAQRGAQRQYVVRARIADAIRYAPK